jgi:predicted nucleic acid-binding protein
VTQWAIVDTGPLVALLDRAEQYHEWAKKQVEQLDPPILVCEPVLVETVSELTNSGASVLSGKITMPTMSKLLIIIKR